VNIIIFIPDRGVDDNGEKLRELALHTGLEFEQDKGALVIESILMAAGFLLIGVLFPD
jgi:hypothetical protein